NGTTPLNADAQIGPVTVVGDWVASNLVAGVVEGDADGFGDADDARISGPGTTDNPNILSKIASVSIGGVVVGTAAPGDHFGFEAQQIGPFRVGGVLVPLTAGPDVVELSPTTGDVTIREL